MSATTQCAKKFLKLVKRFVIAEIYPRIRTLFLRRSITEHPTSLDSVSCFS